MQRPPTTRAERWAATLLMIAATAAMVATSSDFAQTTAHSSGTFELEAGERTERVRLFVTANAPIVDADEEGIPWRGDVEYTVKTVAEARPEVVARVEALPRGPMTEAAAYLPLPEHPDPCVKTEPCRRSYLVTFEKVSPTDEPVVVQWSADASVGWGDDDEPVGADLDISARGGSEDVREPYSFDDAVDSLAADLEVGEAEPLHVFELRFEKAPRAMPGPKAIRVSVPRTVDEPVGRLRLIPEESGDPVPDVAVGRVSFFNPFERCRPSHRCVVGYRLELRRPPDERYARASVAFSSDVEGIELHEGGLVFESVPAQIDRVIERTFQSPYEISYPVEIGNPSHFPNRTVIEVEGLLEAALVGRAPKVPTEVEFNETKIVLTKADRRDSATALFVHHCRYPCDNVVFPARLSDVRLDVGPWPMDDARVHLRLTLRLRFPEFDQVPRDVTLLLRGE